MEALTSNRYALIAENVLAEFDPTKNQYNRHMFDAVTFGDITKLRSAVQSGARVEDRGSHGETALEMAVRLNRPEMIDELLNLGADLNATNHRENTVLHEVVKKENTELIDFLLSKEGIDLDVRNASGKTVLHILTASGKRSIVKKLLEHGACTNIKSNDGRTPLHWAAIHGDIETAKLLLAHGANINLRNNHNTSALIFAAHNQEDEMVEFLVYREAVVAGENLDSDTALKLTVSHSNTPLMAYLLDALIEQSRPSLDIIISEILRIRDHLDKLDEYHLFSYISGKLAGETSFDEEVGFELLLILHSPIKFINWMLKENIKTRDSNFTKLLLKRFQKQNQEKTILRFLLRLDMCTRRCAIRHEIEHKSLMDFVDIVERAIDSVFDATNLDNQIFLLKLLMPDVVKRDHHKLLQFARSFQEESMISYCLINDMKILFDKPQVAGIVDKVFRTPLRETIMPSHRIGTFDLKSVRVRRSLALRSCPLASYSVDFLSKIVAMCLVGYISINIYGGRFGADYQAENPVSQITAYEVWMMLMILTSILHELGELIDNDFSLTDYAR